MIAIIDYGVGNVGSIYNMLKKIGANPVISSNSRIIRDATHIVLPGVGLFDVAVSKLEELKIISVLESKVLVENTPLLGICLGMQLLTHGSEEGDLPGLGWIDAETVKFKNKDGQNGLKIPHMGWNVVSEKKNSKLLSNCVDELKFYFLHSYFVKCNNQKDVLTETYYGHNFVSAFEHKKIIGVQFHPEKSHRFGMNFLKNFVERF